MIDEPSSHRRGAVGRVRAQPFGVQVELLRHPFQHGLCRSDFSLPDRMRRLYIDDPSMTRVG